MAEKSHARKDSRLKTQHREAIKTSMIINRLTDHVDGKVEMSATQVTAGLGLLRKVLPDLKATEHDGELKIDFPNQVNVNVCWPKDRTGD